MTASLALVDALGALTNQRVDSDPERSWRLANRPNSNAVHTARILSVSPWDVADSRFASYLRRQRSATPADGSLR